MKINFFPRLQTSFLVLIVIVTSSFGFFLPLRPLNAAVWDSIDIRINTPGQIPPSTIGSTFSLNEAIRTLNLSMVNISSHIAHDVVAYFEVRAEESIGGEGDSNILCRGRATVGDVVSRSPFELPYTLYETKCAPYPAGGRYTFNLNITSTSPDVLSGTSADYWITRYFWVYPAPLFSSIDIIGTPTIQRNYPIPDNPIPADALFFLSEELSPIRDVGFAPKVKLSYGIYSGGVVNASEIDRDDVMLRFRLYDPGMNLHCERGTEQFSLKSRGALSRLSELGWKAEELYHNCPAFNVIGRWTVEWATRGADTDWRVITNTFQVGRSRSAVVNTSIPAPQRPRSIDVLPASGNSDGSDASNVESTVVQVKESAPDYCAGRRDSDGDGLSDSDEIQLYGTNIFSRDSDGDGFSDILEILMGYNPLGSGVRLFKATDSIRCLEQKIRL